MLRCDSYDPAGRMLHAWVDLGEAGVVFHLKTGIMSGGVATDGTALRGARWHLPLKCWEGPHSGLERGLKEVSRNYLDLNPAM